MDIRANVFGPDSAVSDGIEEVEYDGKPCVKIFHDDKWTIVDAICPHRGAPLTEGAVAGNIFICKRHGAMFDLRTGEWLRGPPCKNLNIMAQI